MSSPRPVVIRECLIGALALCSAVVAENRANLVAAGAKANLVRDGFQFTEGPAADSAGNVYFTDVRASRIYKWSHATGQVKLWRENTEAANGLYFDKQGRLFACQGGKGRIIRFDDRGNESVVADAYGGKRFNRPNDLWVAPDGGIYFTDPMYGRGAKSQDGEHVYYVSPDRKRVVRVVDDMTRPNGLIGTPDGKTLYIADAGARKTYRCRIQPDGSLSDKTLFAESGSDGVTLDERGNLYLTADAVLVFSPQGKLLTRIEVPQRPSNVTFCGPERQTLFITARTGVYTLAMSVRGAPPTPPAK